MTGGGPGGWPSGWNVYYVVVLAGALALLLPLALWVVSRALSRGNPSRAAEPTAAALIRSENPAESGRRSNPRVFQALSAAFVLIVLALLMIPCAVTLPQSMLGLVCILSLSFVAGLALLYGVRKRDLDWLRSWTSADRGSGAGKER